MLTLQLFNVQCHHWLNNTSHKEAIMSRTIKDKKITLRYDEDIFSLNVPDLRKKKKSDHVYWPMSTPSWWTRMIINRPYRRAIKMWERNVMKTDIEDVVPNKEPRLKYYY